MYARFSTLDWNDLRYFLVVAKAGTIRGGADIIGANHTTISRRLSALEASLQARLFDRRKSGLQLTQLGEELLPYALRIEAEIGTVSRIVAGRDTRPAGPVHVSMPPFMALTSIMEDIADFAGQYEDIDIHLDTSNHFADLSRQEADISIRYSYDVNEDVVGRRVLQCAKAIYCSPEYARRVHNDGGAGLSWIGWNEDENAETADWVQDSVFPKARLRHRFHDPITQLAMAASGAGLIMAPCFLADKYPGLVRAPFHEPVLDRSLWLLLHGDLRKATRIRVFVDYLADCIKRRRGEFQVQASEYA